MLPLSSSSPVVPVNSTLPAFAGCATANTVTLLANVVSVWVVSKEDLKIAVI